MEFQNFDFRIGKNQQFYFRKVLLVIIFFFFDNFLGKKPIDYKMAAREEMGLGTFVPNIRKNIFCDYFCDFSGY